MNDRKANVSAAQQWFDEFVPGVLWREDEWTYPEVNEMALVNLVGIARSPVRVRCRLLLWPLLRRLLARTVIA